MAAMGSAIQPCWCKSFQNGCVSVALTAGCPRRYTGKGDVKRPAAETEVEGTKGATTVPKPLICAAKALNRLLGRVVCLRMVLKLHYKKHTVSNQEESK